jgi:hypothetical protein
MAMARRQRSIVRIKRASQGWMRQVSDFVSLDDATLNA